MKVAMFSSKNYEEAYFTKTNHDAHQIFFFKEKLDADTAVKAKDFDTVCCFATNKLDRQVVNTLAKLDIKLIALRSAGFDCTLLANDPEPNNTCIDMGVIHTTKEDLYRRSNIITLHGPLNQETHRMINDTSIRLMKKGVILINTGRGALIDTPSVIDALKSQKIAALGIDVYEREQNLFFEDHSNDIIFDETFVRLQALPSVLITGHQAYLTEEAMINIAQMTIDNITHFEKGVTQNKVNPIATFNSK